MTSGVKVRGAWLHGHISQDPQYFSHAGGLDRGDFFLAVPRVGGYWNNKIAVDALRSSLSRYRSRRPTERSRSHAGTTHLRKFKPNPMVEFLTSAQKTTQCENPFSQWTSRLRMGTWIWRVLGRRVQRNFLCILSARIQCN